MYSFLLIIIILIEIIFILYINIKKVSEKTCKKVEGFQNIKFHTNNINVDELVNIYNNDAPEKNKEMITDIIKNIKRDDTNIECYLKDIISSPQLMSIFKNETYWSNQNNSTIMILKNGNVLTMKISQNGIVAETLTYNVSIDRVNNKIILKDNNASNNDEYYMFGNNNTLLIFESVNKTPIVLTRIYIPILMDIPVQLPQVPPLPIEDPLPIQAPIQLPTQAPIQLPTQAPIQLPTQAPLSTQATLLTTRPIITTMMPTTMMPTTMIPTTKMPTTTMKSTTTMMPTTTKMPITTVPITTKTTNNSDTITLYYKLNTYPLVYDNYSSVSENIITIDQVELYFYMNDKYVNIDSQGKINFTRLYLSLSFNNISLRSLIGDTTYNYNQSNFNELKIIINDQTNLSNIQNILNKNTNIPVSSKIDTNSSTSVIDFLSNTQSVYNKIVIYYKNTNIKRELENIPATTLRQTTTYMPTSKQISTNTPTTKKITTTYKPSTTNAPIITQGESTLQTKQYFLYKNRSYGQYIYYQTGNYPLTIQFNDNSNNNGGLKNSDNDNYPSIDFMRFSKINFNLDIISDGKFYLDIIRIDNNNKLFSVQIEKQQTGYIMYNYTNSNNITFNYTINDSIDNNNYKNWNFDFSNLNSLFSDQDTINKLKLIITPDNGNNKFFLMILAPIVTIENFNDNTLLLTGKKLNNNEGDLEFNNQNNIKNKSINRIMFTLFINTTTYSTNYNSIEIELKIKGSNIIESLISSLITTYNNNTGELIIDTGITTSILINTFEDIKCRFYNPQASGNGRNIPLRSFLNNTIDVSNHKITFNLLN